MAIKPLPQPPQRTDDPDTFVPKGDALMAALPAFVTETNAVQAEVSANAAAVAQAAAATNTASATAVAAANTAQATATASAWVSGKAYSKDQCAISPSNYQTYRRITAGSGTTDPAGDLANWALLFGNDANGAFLPIALTSGVIDLSKGNYFTHTVNGAVTYSIINCPSPGYSFTLEATITSGSTAFPSSVKLPGDSMPAMSTGKTHMLMLVTSNSGARWRMTVAPNYAT